MLSDYLKIFFVNELDLIEAGHVSAENLATWQRNKIFPMPSYVIKTSSSMTSFFGDFHYNEVFRWYPKTLTAWFGYIKSLDYSIDFIEKGFKCRYVDEMEKLKLIGMYHPMHDDIGLREDTLREVWKNFLDGTYGVCTKDCMPENIAIKDVTTFVINEITEKQYKLELSEVDKQKVVMALNLLDSATSLFAPHERELSSRVKIIDTVREIYLSK
ncbi:DUF6058 family natural product biosynthesis protein [Klebsiella oxytoca]